ncbi:MAG: hypothetical protein ABIQ73_27495 [Acidimicrobiales bacterium]
MLDESALYGLVGDFVEAVSPYTEADHAGLALDFLASFGSVVGGGPHAIAAAAQHPARLFVVLVGESARARKGTVRANVRPIFERVAETWSRDCVNSGVGSGEGVISAVADDSEQPNRDNGCLLSSPNLHACSRWPSETARLSALC